ncbi:hypothetical protein BDZ94DRAFT_1180988, partial [Collybia nuda]
MATLQLTWDQRRVDGMWAWDLGNEHLRARIIRSYGKKSIHTAYLGPLHGEYYPGIVILKTAEGTDRVHHLTREAEMYKGPLKNLQGKVVPKCFGFYTGKRNGVDLGCLVLEYCSGPNPVTHLQQFNERVMVAACRLHEAGVFHGNLVEGSHFVKSDDDRVRIVDFSTATLHKCPGAHPALTSGSQSDAIQCPELVKIEKVFGYRGDAQAMRARLKPQQRLW